MHGWTVRVGCLALAVGAVGGAAGCAGRPSAQDLWGAPAQSAVHDAHVSVAGSGNGITFQGDGLVVFKPRMAMSVHLQTQIGVLPAALDVLEVDGVTYERVATDQKWSRSTISPPDPTWQNTRDPRLLGEERVGGQRAWHLEASRGTAPLQMWVRARDGFPLKVVTTDAAGSTFTFAFDRFNSGARVDAPAALQVKPLPRSLSGGVGDTLALTAARVGVLSVDTDALSGDDSIRPRPGNRFVVVEVAVQNLGRDPLSTFFDWRLTDSRGFAWTQALPVREPSFAAGELDPGESAQGFLTYEVSQAATALTLSVRIEDDTASFTLA